MAKYEFILDEAAEGQRIDACVRRFLPELPQPTVRESFRRRDVKLDGKRVPPETRVRSGQTVALYCMEQAADPIEVVYEDADVLLVNKRAGVSVVPDDRGGASLIELAHRHLLLSDSSALPPRPCHRLDNPTSGLCLLAKNDHAEAVLVQAFRERTLDKRYTCLVRGVMKPPAATCRAWLRKDAEAARVTIHDAPVPGSKPIVTAYETIEAGPVSRLSVHLITGRTHQIRAHMAALGHPLLGDDLYGDRAFNRQQKARRLMLCATSLTLDTAGELPELDGRTFTVPCPF
ncbi:MAG: RluA family pseudouridine synthase [Christensenellaceae bacterium]|nr:RluA family pseudouridine synthase [Christensenellaceae bacterium]